MTIDDDNDDNGVDQSEWRRYCGGGGRQWWRVTSVSRDSLSSSAAGRPRRQQNRPTSPTMPRPTPGLTAPWDGPLRLRVGHYHSLPSAAVQHCT